jgi:dihydroflavonol-4-reductase
LKVAITGASGFVGSSLTRYFAKNGHAVRAIVRQSSDISRILDLPVELIEADVTDPQSLRGVFNGQDLVVHAAGILGQAGISKSTYFVVNVQGSQNVFTAAKQAEVSLILHISSPGVLGPIVGEPADERTPIAPSNPYEESKAKAEDVACQFINDKQPIIIVRPEFIYGPGDLHVLRLFKAINRGIFIFINGGNNYCHPTYIDDALWGMLLALRKGRVGEIYHLTGQRPVSFRELANEIADGLEVRRPIFSTAKPIALAGADILERIGGFLGFEPPLSRSSVLFFSEDRQFSYQKAQEELGYTPKVSLSVGIRQTIAWYKEQDLL